MCGIAGIFQYKNKARIDETLLTQMRDSMLHRGPDGGANWLSSDGRVGLAHRRLSIIDLSSAATQPMTNEDGDIWLVFNGEIYNHSGLRSSLLNAGHQFRTDHSDTEVLVHGYEEWGLEGLLQRISGDFSIAIWDSKNEQLSLMRDRIGVKPLYFSLQDGMLLFASEIKAILAHPAVSRDVEPISMYHYLSFMATPAPLTMFKGVFKLPAGHYLTLGKDQSFQAVRYWDALPGQAIPREDLVGKDWPAREKYYIENIQKRLTSAVEKRMMSDVPFGVFLSGGVDSSTNVALMSQFMDRPVDTFTVGFKDYEHLNELEEAKLVAKTFHTNHHQVLIDEKDMLGYLDGLIYHQDEPLADWVCIPLYFVSRLAKDAGVTVVQVGEGSDEQFSGYSRYLDYLRMYEKYWLPFRKYLPKTIQQSVAGLAKFATQFQPSWEAYADIANRASRDRDHFWGGALAFWNTTKDKLIIPGSIQASAMPPELLSSGLLPESYLFPDSYHVIQAFNQRMNQVQPGHDILANMVYKEFKQRLPELLLMRVDKIGMSVSLEARVPFLDHELVSFSLDIPMEDKIHGNVTKYLLKKAVEGLIPNEIIYRKKMGFGAPMSQWLREDFGNRAEAKILSSGLMKRGFFNRGFIENLCKDHRSKRNDNGLYIWTLFNLMAWYDYWIEGKAV